MTELSLYDRVDAPHLDGFVRSERGEFRLVPLPGGRTRLEGSTWYELRIGPQPYWRLWSDWLIGSMITFCKRSRRVCSLVRNPNWQASVAATPMVACSSTASSHG